MKQKDEIWRAAESYVGALVMDGTGALYQPVTHDENGWDGLVEFPARFHFGPADRRQSGPQAFVQVKSTLGRQRVARVTLSNAQKMTQPDKAWFLLLLQKNAQDGSWKVYARHIWGDLMADLLKEVRKADASGAQLNKVTTVVRFQDSDRHDHDLASWMNATIETNRGHYFEDKLLLFSTLGLQEDFLKVGFRLSETDNDKLEAAFLEGMPLAVETFTAMETRFGIPLPFLGAEFRPHSLQIEPKPAADCTVHLRGSAGEDAIVLSGSVINSPFGLVHSEKKKLVIKAGFFRMHWPATSDVDPTVSIAIETEKASLLSEIARYAKLRRWTDSGPIDCQILVEGKSLFVGRADLPKTEPGTLWPVLESTAAFLLSIAVTDISVRVSDIFRDGPSLDQFRSVLSPGPLGLTLAHRLDVPPPVAVLYCCSHTIGDVQFCAIVQRPLTSKAEAEAGTSLTFGDPFVRDSYAVDGPELHNQRLSKDYEFWSGLLKGEGNPCMFLGDIMAHLQPSRRAQPDAT